MANMAKTAIVTGALQGIGAEYCTWMAARTRANGDRHASLPPRRRLHVTRGVLAFGNSAKQDRIVIIDERNGDKY
jgi:NAD(P)-dependent dehydrogenase (short-subunit alcohol dehydrogenase family)